MAFPGLPDDLKRFDNVFDYERYTEGLSVKLCNVAWDGLRDVPYFSDDAARDTFFEDAPGESVELKGFARPPRESLAVPLPYDVAVLYNYLVVTIPQSAPGGAVDHEREGGARHLHYFIESADPRATSTTSLELRADLWTTFVNSIDFRGAMLARGHWPVARTDPARFIANPIAEGRFLLAPDVSFGEASIVAAAHDVVLNSGESVGVFCVGDDPRGDFGELHGAIDDVTDSAARNPVMSWRPVGGVPYTRAFCIPVSDIAAFVWDAEQAMPQLLASIYAFFIAPACLVNPGEAFTLNGHACREIDPRPVRYEVADLKVEDFGYTGDAAGFAKLYTSPYAALEVTDGAGGVTRVRVEDTAGRVDVWARLSAAWPFIGITTHLLGVGGAEERSLSFRNLDEQALIAGGSWYRTLSSFDVPCFSIVVYGADAAAADSIFTRKQVQDAARVGYESATASAGAALAAADQSADTEVANAGASASAVTTTAANSGAAQNRNAALSAAASITMTSRSNEASATITDISNATNQATQAFNAGMQRALTETDNKATAATTATRAGFNVATSAISGFAEGGPVGAVVGAVGAGINAAAEGVTAAIAINAAWDKTQATIDNSQSLVTSQNESSRRTTSQTNSAQSDNAETAAEAATGQIANAVDAANANAGVSAGVIRANANRSAATAKSNAQLAYDAAVANAERARDLALRGVAREVYQRGLNPPARYGEARGDAANVTRPAVVSVNVVTQPPGAIAQAAAAFKRYGYALNQYVEIDDLAQMGGWTYWECADVWAVATKGAPESARRAICDMMRGGVTVWTDPEGVGFYDGANEPRVAG